MTRDKGYAEYVRSFFIVLALLATPVIASSDAFAAQKKPKKSAPSKSKAAAKEKEKEKEKEVEKIAEPKVSESKPVATPAMSEELRGPTRIDFDDRLIQGQTNKSGAVYLFDRKETGISSMVKRRKSFRQLTLSTIYDR
jgi:hypothetical protein